MDDNGVQYSIGQQFVTTDCLQCFCGDGGRISCDQSQCKSNTSSKLTITGVIIKLVSICNSMGCRNIWN